ncbi:MAG: type I restriction-modification system subunit M [Bacillota bacterium]
MTSQHLINEIWRACDIMRRDNNCGGVMEYVEHLAWVLFLKFLDEQEHVFEQEAAIYGRTHNRILEPRYRWSAWVPKALGEKNPETGNRLTPEWTADEVLQFLWGQLFPYLANLSGSPEREVIAGVFSDRNIVVCASPYNLKDILDIIDGIDFTNPDDKHAVSVVYEDLLRRLGHENKLAGEFYTPRPVARFVVRVVDPRVGETVYDPACGSCGFLAEAFVHMQKSESRTTDYETLQGATFYGNEKKSIPALLGIMNMVLHGVLAPVIRRRNTLEENLRTVTERHDVVVTNPPFGGTENTQIQNNFPVKSNATELLFIQHIMKKLKANDGARCGLVIPDGTLFRGGAFTTVKRDLLESFNLYFVVSLPPGVFAPYSDVRTSLLFFERPGPTREVLYYQMLLPKGVKKFSKGYPIRDEHFAEADALWAEWNAWRRGQGGRPELPANAWLESLESLAAREYDLSAHNPNQPDEALLPHPSVVVADLVERSRELHGILLGLQERLGNGEEDDAE